jgi:hypothetical protein
VTTSRSSYRLKRYLSSRDPDFAAALMIYVRNTPANIRTDTNEITYWLDKYAEKFGDVFHVFGFYRDRQLVGYAEAAYFRDERLIALDYITIDSAYRRNNIFFEFVDQLKQYFEETYPEYRYGVAEVTYGVGQQYPSQDSRLMVRLLKLQGFHVIHAPYFQPRLMLDDAESEMPADLLIFSTTQMESIKVDTYLSIVHTLYYKYYLPWKSVSPAGTEEYKAHIDELYSKIRSGLKKKKSVPVNGHSTILQTPRRKPVVTVHRIVSFSLQALLVITLLTAAMLGLKAAFNLSNASFAAIYVLAIASFMAVAGIVSKEARDIFAQFVMLAKFFSRRKIDGSRPTELEAGRPSTRDLSEQ